MSETPVLPEGQDSFRLNEVCKLAKVQPYMLRFWTTEFSGLEAGKSGTGQRYYTREQVELILEIRRLLFDEQMTIAGAKKKLAASGAGGEVKKKASAAPKKARERKKVAARERPPEPDTGASDAPAEVDKGAEERVQRLLLVLRETRGEIQSLLAGLRNE